MYKNDSKLCRYDIKRNAKKVFSILRYSFFAVGVGSFVAFALSENINCMLISILLIFLSNLCFSLSSFSGRITYTLFLCSFFCFLLGRMTMDLFTMGSARFYFSDSISKHILISIALSLIFLQFGFELFERIHVKNVKIINRQKETVGYCNRLQLYALLLFYISAVFAIIINIEQIIFLENNSYVELFTDFSSRIPRIFHIIANMYIAAFLMFLGTSPQKKKCILPCVLFLIIAVVILISGDRGGFMINTGIVVVYFFWRQYTDKEIWISNKIIIIVIICTPLILAGLSFFVYLREGVDVGEKNIVSQFIRFFKSTGNTVDLLGYGKQYEQRFPQSFYSFGELIDYVKFNPISEKLFAVTEPVAYTEEYAMTMHSYAHTISYFIFPDQYLLGHGKGSSYIAEVYLDFGYLGIIICNFIYGIFLAGIYKLRQAKPLIIAIAFIALRILFYVPRGPMISPVSYVLNLTTIAVIVFLHSAAKYQPAIMNIIKTNLRKRK